MGSAKSRDLPLQTSVFNLEDTQIIEEATSNAAFMIKSINNVTPLQRYHSIYSYLPSMKREIIW